MQELKFSVIVPVLNGVAHLEQCLDGVLQQASIPELIVIDGGSTDGTLNIITSYKQHISYWETGKDKGISDAFNRGILRAKGDIIAILNSDDFWEPDTILIISEAAGRHPEADIFIAQCRLLPTSALPYVKKPNMNAMKRYMSIYHPSTFVKRNAYATIGLYNESYQLAMDSEWMHRAMKMSLTFQEVHAIVANMRMGGISDKLAFDAIKEYRQSVVQNSIASPAYATLFYWLHKISKTLDNYPPAKTIKQLVNKMINSTVDYH